MFKLTKASLIMLSMIFMLFLAACSGGEESSTNAGNTSNDKEEAGVEDVKVILNWFPKAQHPDRGD